MSIRLIVEVLDGAPDDLTFRERYVLVVLAENARDSTRLCWPGIEDNPEIARRLRLSRTQMYAVMKALVGKGALERVQRGQKGVRAVYRIPPFSVQRPENRDPDESLSVPKTGTLNDSQRPGSEHSASRFSTFSVPESGTPIPQTPQDPSSTRARARATDQPGDASDEEEKTKIIDKIVQVLGETTGRHVDRAHAERVARQIGTGKSNTLAYVEKCIRSDPARFVPTSQPPRFTAANGFES